MGDRRRPGGGDGSCAPTVTLGAGVLVAAVWTDVHARARSRNEAGRARRGATRTSPRLRHQVAVTRFAKAVTTAKRDAAAGVDRLHHEPAGDDQRGAGQHQRARLRAGRQHRHAADLPRGCQERTRPDRGQQQRPGRQGHLGGLGRRAPSWRVAPAPASSTPSTSPTPRSSSSGRPTYAYATNSVAGNIQIIDSDRPGPLDRGRQRAAEPPHLGHRPTTPGPPRSP